MKKPNLSSRIDARTGTEISPLNQNLFNEFKIEELEERYETDPLMLVHLFGLGAAEGDNDIRGCACNKIGNCPHLQCGCDGPYTTPPTCPELGCSPVISVG